MRDIDYILLIAQGSGAIHQTGKPYRERDHIDFHLAMNQR